MMQKYIYKIHKLINQTLSPQFLQKLDRYLLLHHPRVWAIKIHYVCYYVLLINTSIICFVIGYPIKLYQFQDLLIIGFIIFIIIELILLIYWLDLQSLYNVEKQYGNSYKKYTDIFLEILCYSACIILIFSPSIVFHLSTTLKASFIIPQTKLSTDILIMDLIDADRFRVEDINNLTDIDAYFYKLETYVERKEKEAQQQKKQNDCQNKYDQLRIDDNNNKLLSSFLTTIHTCENMLLLQDGKIEENTQKVLTDSLTSKKIESIKVKDQIGELIKSIRNSEYEKIRVIISQYIEVEGKKEGKLKVLEILDNAETNAYTTYSVIYKNPNVGSFLKLYYFIFHFILLVGFLFRNIDSIDFILSLVYYFSIIILAILARLALDFTFSALPWFKGALKEILNIIVYSPTFFVVYQAIAVRNNKIYSYFKIINLIAFPFVLFLSACVVLRALDHTTFKHFVIASLLYLPFIPYLKSELIRQLSLPKD